MTLIDEWVWHVMDMKGCSDGLVMKEWMKNHFHSLLLLYTYYCIVYYWIPIHLMGICLEQNIIVINTRFVHEMIHLQTWQSRAEWSMIDFVIVDEHFKSEGYENVRGINVGTDQFLVVSRIAGLFNKWKYHPCVQLSEEKRVKVENLRAENNCDRYNKLLSERFRK